MLAMSYYLGPSHPLTALQTFDDVEAAAKGGLLAENQWVELKKDLGPSNTKNNVELAKDLASLSLDGGLLVFGIEDKTYEVVGFTSEGLESRVSQVAATRIHPPLSPVTRLLESEDGRQVLLVVVPASPLAPHMVEDSYWGRSSDGKMKLPDARIRQLMEARAVAGDSFRERLLGMVDEDPLYDLTEGGREEAQGHLYLRAEPLTPIMGTHPKLMDLVRKVPAGAGDGFQSCKYTVRDPEGQACISGQRVMSSSFEHSLHWISLTEAGALRAVFGGASVRQDSGTVTLAALVALATLQFVVMVKELAAQTGYTGQWRVGIHMTQLKNAQLPSTETFYRNQASYPLNDYTRIATVTPLAWTDRGQADAEELLMGYLRGLGRQDWSVEETIAGKRQPSC